MSVNSRQAAPRAIPPPIEDGSTLYSGPPIHPESATVTAAIDEIEWPNLTDAGHRRARFSWRGGQLESHWLAPKRRLARRVVREA
jgi:hypothetical protein